MKKLVFILPIALLLLTSSCDKINPSVLNKKIKGLEAEQALLRDSITMLEDEKVALGLDYGRLLEHTALPEGTFFEVQIGAFQYFDLDQYNESFIRLRNDQTSQLNKYVLGRFIEYSVAHKFLKDINSMGIEDAFVVGYVDGERVKIGKAIQSAKLNYGL